MGFPQLPTWVSNFVKNIPRTFPTEAVSSAAKAIAQTMPPDEPVVALMPEHDPCADLALEELAQMPMELIDPEARKYWCRDYLEQKRLASLPQPDPLAVFNKAIPVPDTPTPSDGKTGTPFTYRSLRDLLKPNTSSFVPLLPSNTGGSSSTPDLLHNTPLEGQAREFQENLNHGLNVIRNRGQNNTPDSPPGGGSPGFSGQIVVDGIIVAIERNGEQYPINAEWYWNRYGADGDKPFFRPDDPLGWNDPAPQIQFGSATFDIHLPGLPSAPDIPKKQPDPDDFDVEEWLKNNQELGRLGLRALLWPVDLLASAREYERNKSLGNLINLILSGLPIVGLLGDVAKVVDSLLRKIPSIDSVIDKVQHVARGILGKTDDIAAKASDWLSDFERPDITNKAIGTSRNAADYRYQIAQTGSTNEIRVRFPVPYDETLDVDGVILEEGYFREVKRVSNLESSPWIEGSNIPEKVKTEINRKIRDEFERYGLILNHPDTPMRGLEVVVNDEKAVKFFDDLMKEFKIPGRVVVRR